MRRSKSRSTNDQPLWLILSTLIVACVATACGNDAPRLLQLEMTLGDESFRYVENFRVAAIRTRDDRQQAITCDTVRIQTFANIKTLPVVATSDDIPRTSGGEPETLTVPLKVPAEVPLLIAVEGRAQWAKAGLQGHVVTRGCKEHGGFAKGTQEDFFINAHATVGKACTNRSDCETTLDQCFQTQFPGGYCSRACVAKDECPPGSACVSGSTTTLCARHCTDASDCEGGFDCNFWNGPDGCSKICAPPDWSPSTRCNQQQ